MSRLYPENAAECGMAWLFTPGWCWLHPDEWGTLFGASAYNPIAILFA